MSFANLFITLTASPLTVSSAAPRAAGWTPTPFTRTRADRTTSLSPAAPAAGPAWPAWRSHYEPRTPTCVVAGTADLALTTAMLLSGHLVWRIRNRRYRIGPSKRLGSRPTAGQSRPLPPSSTAPAGPYSD